MSGIERCSQCGEEIDGQPLYPSRDLTADADQLTYVDDPDGPFCGVACRREYDAE